jgi:uncharacterized coiled-coil protein SlyX
MNDSPSQEKDLRGIMAQLINHRDVRDKLICEIDDIIDRIKQNRKPLCEPKESNNCATTPVEVFVNSLRERVREVDLSNEKLQLIVNRLNELI